MYRDMGTKGGRARGYRNRDRTLTDKTKRGKVLDLHLNAISLGTFLRATERRGRGLGSDESVDSSLDISSFFQRSTGEYRINPGWNGERKYSLHENLRDLIIIILWTLHLNTT
jgi:hypothetical protein